MKRLADLSHLNTITDWKLLSRNIDVLVLKASEGVTVKDPKMDSFDQAAGMVGIPVKGHYHFYHSKDDPSQQAGWFLSCAPLAATLIIDLEWSEDPTEWESVAESKRYEDLQTFTQILDEAGREIIVYTTHAFMTQYLPAATFLGKYKLWLASYGQDPGALPAMFKDWTWWQYTEKGSLPGVAGNVDLSWVKDAA